MKVNLKVIEAKNIPIVDVRGTCDGYCKIKFGQQKAQTRTIDNSLTPHWRQQFSFDILDIQEDFLFIQLYDHDTLDKDDLISDLEIQTKQLKPGVIIDKWYTMNPIIKDKIPEIHLLIHIAQEKDPPFVENPFKILVTNIRIISAKDIDTGEYTVSVGYKKELMKETRKTNNFIWQEEFALAMPLDEPVLSVKLNKGKTLIGDTRIFIGFNEGEIEKKWYPLKGKGSLKLAIQVASLDSIPFLGEKFDDLPPVMEMTACFRIIEGKQLTAKDSNGKNDAYCTLANLKTPKNIEKTQIIFKTTHPKWNYFLNVKIHDYSSDVIRISCYDYDKIGSNDIIGYKDLSVKDMGNGQIKDEWISIYDNKSGSGGQLHIMYQICTIGWNPFDQNSILPLKKIHLHIMEAYDVPNTDNFGKTDPYVRVKLNDQEFVQKTNVINNSLNPVWDKTITLYSLCSNVSVQIELKDESMGKDPLIGTKNIDITNLKPDETKEIEEELIPAKGMKKAGIIHLYIQINQEQPFKNIHFTRHIDLGKKTKKGNGALDSIDKIPITKPLLLFVKVIQAFNLKSMDSNGLSDPYCILQLNNQKKNTSLISECLNPKWDEYFIFDLVSLNKDFLKIDCMDQDKISDELIGNAEIPIKTLRLGAINDLEISLNDKKNAKTGTLKISLHVAKMGDIPFEEKIWKQKVLNIRILEGNFTKGYLYWTGRFNNEKDFQFLSTQRKGGKWMEEYQMIYSYENDAILKLYEHSKKEIEKGEIRIPYKDLKYGEIIDRNFAIGKNGLIHLILELNDLGNVPFSTIPPLDTKDNLSICKEFTFNIRIIEGRDIPGLDKKGLSDPYIKLYLLGMKPKERNNEVKTKVVKKTLNPVWYEEYHFPIKSIGTDILHLSLKDSNSFGSDDPISTYDFNIKNLPCGKVVKEWIKFIPVKGVPKGGEIHIQYHLACPGSYAFKDKPFTTKTLYIKIIEAKEVKSCDLNGLSDPYCKMQIIGDRVFSKTTIKYETLSPYWDESFTFLITDYENAIFKLELMDKDKFSDDFIGITKLELKKFKIGQIYKQWLEVQNTGKKTGLVKVEINIVETGSKAFEGEIITDEKKLLPSDNWEINIHLLKASNLPSADSNGLSDPYCVFTILNTKNSVKSRRIDKSLNPVWDEKFRIPVQSLNSDILRIEVIDWDRIGKHDKLCMIDFPLINYDLGKLYHGVYSLIPLEGRSKGSTIELSFQITPPRIIPFTDTKYIPVLLNVRIEDIKGITTTKENPKPYFNLRLEADSDEGLMSVLKNELNTVIKESFAFMITDKNRDKLIIEYKNEKDKNKILSKCIIPLANIKSGATQEMNMPMQPSGTLHLFMQILEKGNTPFKDINLTPISNSYMTFYIKVISGKNIPVADSSGLSDPFCILELQDRKDKRQTLIRKQTLTPVWNQEFQFKILSYNTDVFILSLYDYDKCSKNDLLGTWKKPIKDMVPGVVQDEEIVAGGTIHVVYQLACANQIKWESKEGWPLELHVKAIEAKEFPNNVGKTDPYLELSFIDDIIKPKTKVLDNTLTPQWFQDFHFYITDLNQQFNVKLWDKNVLKNTLLSEANINLSKHKLNYIYDEWYDMTPSGSYKNGGKVRLETQITEYKEEPFKGPRNPPPPYPISETKMLFNIKIIRGKDIESMDANGFSDPYCTLEFIGYPNSVKKTRIIERTLTPFWDELIQMEIPTISDIVKITLYDYDKLSKNDIISYYTFKISELEFGITKEEELKMIPYSSSIKKPGIISVIYQVTEPCQKIFESKQFEINKLKCYIHSFDNIINGKEYYCEVKTVDSYKGQASNVYTDNLVMETFNLLSRVNQPETLEIILYQNEKKDDYKISKIIKKIKCEINEMGEKYVDGVKFTLAMNDPKITFPSKPPFINEKRYYHIYVNRCVNLPKMDVNELSDSFVRISLNKEEKERYSDCTRIISKDQNPIFNHTFHIPVYSLRDDIITVSLYNYDKSQKCHIIGKVEFNIYSLGYGIVKDEWYKINIADINLITHLSDQNQPAFISKEFNPHYLHVKIFEIKEGKTAKQKCVSVHVKNDLYPKLNYKTSINKSKTPQFSDAIFSIPITNTNDSYVIEIINSNSIESSLECETSGLKEGLIYRYKKNGIIFWTQILQKDKNPFTSKNYADYYDRLPDENYVIQIEIIKMNNLPSNDSINPYYIAQCGEEQFKSRIIYNNRNPFYYDEFKLKIKNLDDKLTIKVFNNFLSRVEKNIIFFHIIFT